MVGDARRAEGRRLLLHGREPGSPGRPPRRRPEKDWTDRDRIDEAMAASGPAAAASPWPPAPSVPFTLPGDSAPRTFALAGSSRSAGPVWPTRGPSCSSWTPRDRARPSSATTHAQAELLAGRRPVVHVDPAGRSSSTRAGRGSGAHHPDRGLRGPQRPGRTGCVRGPGIPAADPGVSRHLRLAADPAVVDRLGIRLVDGWTQSSPEEAAVADQLDLVLGGGGRPTRRGPPHHAGAEPLQHSDPTRCSQPDRARATRRPRRRPVGERPPGRRRNHGSDRRPRHPGPGGTDDDAPRQLGGRPTRLDHGAPRWFLLTEPGTYRVELDPARLRRPVPRVRPHDLSVPFAWLDPGGGRPDPVPVSTQFRGLTTTEGGVR